MSSLGNWLLVLFTLYAHARGKQTDRLWCLKATQPDNLVTLASQYQTQSASQAFEPNIPFNINTSSPFTEVITYHQSHCNILCSTTLSCDMFTYYYNYTCQLYSYNAINIGKTIMITNADTWGTCLMSNISTVPSLIGQQVANKLGIDTSSATYCAMHYNTLGDNIQHVPPEPPFSPSNITMCWQACLAIPSCTHTVYQPKYKEMNVSACWLKTNFSQGIYGMNDVDEMTLASCLRNKADFNALGLDAAYEFMYIPPSKTKKSQGTILVKSLQCILLTVLTAFMLLSKWSEWMEQIAY